MRKTKPTRHIQEQADLSPPARVRIGQLLLDLAPEEQVSERGQTRIVYGRHTSFRTHVLRVSLREFGRELRIDGYLDEFATTASIDDLAHFIFCAAWHLSESHAAVPVPNVHLQAFLIRVQNICRDDNFAYDFGSNGWTPRAETDAAALRIALLADTGDLADCRAGDPQVEMVVSTIQQALSAPGTVLVDYGVGLGRVLAGLGTAARFRTATYVAVDEPVAPSVRRISESVGARFFEQSRTQFVAEPTPADVVILVNTLHHIPFNDLPRQVTAILRALKPSAHLLVHEISELHEPEQRCVPWRMEDIDGFFRALGCPTNPRSTITRTRRVPLAHVLVTRPSVIPSEAAIRAEAEAVWARMKQRTLEDIDRLYRTKSVGRETEIHHLLITNANLDLNRP